MCIAIIFRVKQRGTLETNGGLSARICDKDQPMLRG